MAPRTRAAAAAAEEEEIFTDIDGGGNEAGDDVVIEERDTGLVPQGDKEKIADADLEIAEDDEEEAEDTGETDAEETEEEEEAEETTAVAAVEAIDPRDVQILALEARDLERTKGTLTEASKRAEADMLAAEKAMKTAKEAGDTDADIAATKAWGAAMTAKTTADAELKNLDGDTQKLTRRVQELIAKAPINPETGKRDINYRPDPAAAKVAAKPAGSKLTPKFLKQNAWFNNAKYKAQADTLKRLDRGLEAEGRLKINDPKYFDELARRFNAEHPGLVKTLDGKPVATGQRRRSAGAQIPNSGGGGSPGGGGGRQNPNKVKLTTADLAQMKQFGLDSESKEVRTQWLIEKRALARQGVA